MAAICNLLIHDLFPGENHLAFQMDEDAMDEGLDNCWNEQVCIYPACDVKSLHPSDYLHKLGYNKAGMCLIADVFDIRYPIATKDISGLNKHAILLSTIGRLSPQIVGADEDAHSISLDDKMLLVPNDGYQVDYAFALQLFQKEEILRQLPITRRITWNDMWRVQIERSGLYSEESIDDLIARLTDSEMTSNK